MKTDIILAGVGGQGILSIAAAVGLAAVSQKLYIKQAETHGMSQRGGDVQSHLRLSDSPIAADLIAPGTADLILSVEPMEALRYVPFLSPNGWLVTNINPFINISNYPDIELVMKKIKSMPRYITIDADAIAKDLGAPRASNMVMLGAASPFIALSFEALEDGIRALFAKKDNAIVESNLMALQAGRNYTELNKPK